MENIWYSEVGASAFGQDQKGDKEIPDMVSIFTSIHNIQKCLNAYNSFILYNDI